MRTVNQANPKSAAASPLTQLQIDGEQWEVRSEAEPILKFILADAGETVKRSATRHVTRHRIGNRVFYLKNYFHHSKLFEPVKYWFKPSASRAEWELAPQLEQLGVVIVPHLAHGETWTWRGLAKSSLLTEGPPGFAPLTASVSSASTQQALGRFLRHLHQRAVFHDDLHISNLLYSAERNEFCLVDLDNIHVASALTLEDKLNNLATLNRRFPLQREFLEAYDPEFLRYRNKIERRTLRRIRESIPRKLKFLFEDRVAFAPMRIGKLRWHVRRNAWNEKLNAILDAPDEALSSRARMLKNGTRSTVGSIDGFVLKRFNVKKISSIVFDLVRDSRGRRGFKIARHLELLRVATPRPIAFADERKFGAVIRSYFVMEEIPDAVYLWERPKARGIIISRLATLIAKTHDEGFSHRDLKETNVIMDSNNVPHLIDLDALRYIGKVSDARAAIELARLSRGFERRLHLSTKERTRFLKSYCQYRNIQDWRKWWNQIMQHLPATRSAK